MISNFLIYMLIFCMFGTYAITAYSSPNSTIAKVVKINFQDGKIPGVLPQTQEPARIMIDSTGNKFLRFIANFGDQQSIPAQYPSRVRATMYMTKPHWEMPELNDTNKHISYSADIRFIDNKDRRPGYVANSFFELFQGSNIHKSTGYAAMDSAGGPPARLIRNRNGQIALEIIQERGPNLKAAAKQYDLGYYSANEFHNFKIDAVWSLNPNEGGYKVYIDGQQKLELKGCTYYNPRKSNLVPAFKVGLYGTNAVGTVDVDNVEIRNLSERN